MTADLTTLTQQILDREIVTVGAAATFSGLSRAEVLSFIVAQELKIYDEETGVWYNESALGHC